MSQPKPKFPLSRQTAYAAVATAAVAALVAAATLSHRPHSTASNARGGVLRVANQKGGTRALMEAAGVLQGAPYKVEWSLFPAASPLLEALGADAVDTGAVGEAPFAFAVSGGAKIRAVQATRTSGDDRESAIVAPANSPIRTVQDLKGRRIGVIRGSAGHDLILRVLEHAGLKPADVQYVFLDNGESKAALSTGAIDAWATWGSYVGIAILHDNDRIVADVAGLKRGVGVQVATDEAIADKGPMLDDFLRRLAEAHRWAHTHKEAYAQVLARETGVPLDVARFTVQTDYTPVEINPALVAEAEQTFDRYQRAGVISKVPDLSGAYDPQFNDAVRP